jgi:chromosome segregation ATPase
MKAKRPKGMRDIMTVQGLGSRSIPNSREQIMTELSRLEHEKARLGREREIWATNQQKAEGRLQAAEERIGLLQAALDEQRQEQPDQPATARRSASFAEEPEEAPTSWRAVVLKY